MRRRDQWIEWIREVQRESAHHVRKYRNRIVHDQAEEIDPVSLADATRFLCRYFSFLPPDW
jgi:hypothetical protein